VAHVGEKLALELVGPFEFGGLGGEDTLRFREFVLLVREQLGLLFQL
jgi:hypothetical protein